MKHEIEVQYEIKVKAEQCAQCIKKYGLDSAK